MKHGAQAVVERGHAHGILLGKNQMRQGGRRDLAIFKLTQRRRWAAVRHAFARIEHQIREQICFVFILLEVKLVGTTEDFPIHVAQVVTRHVFTMLSEFN